MVFRSALTIQRIGGPPKRQRADVIIIPINVNAPVINVGGKEVGDPLAGLGISEIKPATPLAFVLGVQNPIGVLFFASAATLIVSKVVTSKGGEPAHRL